LNTELSADGIFLAFGDRVVSMASDFIYSRTVTLMLTSKWVSSSAYRVSSRFTCLPKKVIQVALSICSRFALARSILKRVESEMATCRWHQEHKVLADVKWCVNAM